MKVRKPKETQLGKAQVGDIFEIEIYNNLWILVKEGLDSNFILRELGGRDWQGLSGHHDSIESLLNHHKGRILNHYSKDEYELQLVKKI